MQAYVQQAKSNLSAAYLFTYPPGPAHQHNENNPKTNPQSHDYKGDPSHNTGFQQDVPEFAGRCFINQNTLEQREMKRGKKKKRFIYFCAFYKITFVKGRETTLPQLSTTASLLPGILPP